MGVLNVPKKNTLTEKNIILELQTIQGIITPDYYILKKASLREILDNIRITAQYLKFDNESLQRELENAKKKK